MKKPAAKRTIVACMKATSQLNEALLQIKKSAGKDEFAYYKKHIGRILGDILVDVMRPVLAEYPELEPDAWK